MRVKLSVVMPHAVVHKSIGPMFAVVIFNWRFWAFGLEFVPYGILFFAGPASIGVVHQENYARAKSLGGRS